MQEKGSRTVAAAALRMVSSEDRAEEALIKEFLLKHPEYKIEKEIKLLPTNLQDGFYICKMIKGGK